MKNIAKWILCLVLCMAMTAACGAATAEQDRTVEFAEETIDVQPRVSNETAEREYLNALFGLPVVKLPKKLRGNAGGSGFTDNSMEQKLYNALRNRVEEVADGARSSTKFTFTADEFTPMAFDHQDLGISESEMFGSDGKASQKAKNAIQELVSSRFYNVIYAVLYDCPYDLFWHHAYGVGYSYSWSLVNGVPQEPINLNISINISVSNDYLDPDATDEYTVNAAKINSAKDAAANAQAIRDEYAGLGDYDKLTAYKNAICDMVSYNHPAADEDWDYGDPWQLVWVFDNDPATKVVCEGYSKAFQYLCDISDWANDVEVICVSGLMLSPSDDDPSQLESEPHMWNLVRINDQNYLADITNSDDTQAEGEWPAVGADGGLFLNGYDDQQGDLYLYDIPDSNGIQIGYVYDAQMATVYAADRLNPADADLDPQDVITLPEADARLEFRVVDREAADNRFDLLLNDWADFEFAASGVLEDMTAPYEVILDGEVYDELWLDNSGFAQTHWTTDSSGQVGRHVMYVQFQMNGTWYYSNAYIINVTAPYTITGPLTWTADPAMDVYADGNGQTVYAVARDGRLLIDVDNIRGQDVRFYGMYIEDGNSGWIADSHWVEASDWQKEPTEANATTRVALTVPRCTAGEDYQVTVFAVKQGAPFLTAAEPVYIHVTPEADPDCPVIVSMADRYETGEPIRVFAHYTNPDQAEDVRLRIRIRNVNLDWDVIFDDEGDPADFWNDGVRCWHASEFAVDAYVTGRDNATGEEIQIGAYEDIHRFTVEADPDVAVAAPQLAEPFTTHRVTDDLELHITSTAGEGTVAADRIEIGLVRLDWGHEWIWGDEAETENGSATFTIPYMPNNGAFEAGGYYMLWISGQKAGYDEITSQYRFVMTGDDLPENPNLTLTVDGTTETPQEKNSSTDMEVRVTWAQGTPRPTAVRVLNGDNWEYWWEEDEGFAREWAFHEDALLMYAEATWTDIDIEAIAQNGWKITENGEEYDFDWNRDVTWTGRSNEIRVAVSSPNGDMLPANYTIRNDTDGEGNVSVEWGDDLVVVISDEGPMGIDAAGGDAHVIPGSWYAGHIYRWEEDGRWERVNRDFTYPVENGVNHFPTGDLTAGRYRVEIGTDAPGYTGKSAYKEFFVTEPEAQSAFFQINKTVLHPGEPFIATVYAPGAERVRITGRDENDDDFTLGEWDGDRGSNGMGDEWRFEETGNETLSAWARYPEETAWTPIYTIQIPVQPREPLAKAQFIVNNELDVTRDNTVTIPLIDNGYHYTLQIHTNDMENEPVYRYDRTADEAESGNVVFTIPANTLEANRSYWLDCHVDPAERDYAHEGSDSSMNVLTVGGIANDYYDGNITVSVDIPKDGNNQLTYPINKHFEVTVNLKEGAVSTPTAVAVYMGDHTEYQPFSGTSAVFGMSEYQPWPEVIYARACYEDLSGYGEEIPWDELNWGNPSESFVSVAFTASGRAEPPEIDYPEISMTGNYMVIGVTLGANANEAHANLDRNLDGRWEDRVFGDWFGWDPEGAGRGRIVIPTDGIEPGRYMLYVDSSGEGYENARSRVEIRIAENPAQADSVLNLPADLMEIGEEAFQGTDADAVIIPEGVTSIGRRAFAGSSVRLVLIPENVAIIGEGAFAESNIEMVYGYNSEAENLAAEYDAEFCLIH